MRHHMSIPRVSWTVAAFGVASLILPLCIAPAAFSEEPASSVKSNEEREHEHAHEHEHGELHDEFENIVVTATPLDHSPDEVATPVNKLDREEVLGRLRPTLGETLSNIPGISSSGFSAGASRPVIRGQDAFRTEVLEDGLSMQDVSRLSPDHAIPVNPLSSRSIEVVRGPAVLRYGGGASAGVVNVLTNRIPAAPIAEPVTGELVGIWGSNEDQGDFSGLLEGGIGDFTWHADGLYRESDDYETGAGNTQDGTDTETWAASGGGAYHFDEGRVGFSYTRFDSEYGIPEDEPVLIDMRSNRYRFEGEWDGLVDGLREVRVRGVYSDYKHDEIADGEVGQTFDNDEFDGRLELLHDPIGGFVGAFGFHGRTQDLKASGEAAEFMAPSDTTMFAGYLFEERPIAHYLDVQAGLRVEGNWVEGTPISGDMRSRSFLPVSGSLALIGHPSDRVSTALSGSVSQRAPSQVELFARGPHEATGTFEIGDPDFDEETSYTGELRVSGDFERVRFEAASFVTWYEDFIFGQLTGETVDELDELFYEDRNALFWGGEISLGVDLFELCGGTVGTEWQFDYVRARFTDGSGDRNVPRITPMRWGGSLVYQHDLVKGSFGFLRHESQWDPSDAELATNSFTMLDLTLQVRLPFLENVVETDLWFTASNLLDEAARNAVSFTKDEVRLPGRTFRVGVRTSF